MLFSHLHQYERELSISRNLPVVGGPIHPAVLELGLRQVHIHRVFVQQINAKNNDILTWLLEHTFLTLIVSFAE